MDNNKSSESSGFLWTHKLEMERREVNGHCSLFKTPCYGKGVGDGKRSGEGRNIYVYLGNPRNIYDLFFQVGFPR